jgi:hypothetical protein
MLDITGVDPILFIKNVYALSVPVGMGFLHFREGELDDATAVDIWHGHFVNPCISMDYVHGRGCKMTVWNKNGRLYIDEKWFDHTPEQLQKLFDMCNITPVQCDVKVWGND